MTGQNDTIVCENCDTPNPIGSRFCNHCGTRLPIHSKIFCPSCQEPNPRNRLYCDNCGHRLHKTQLPQDKSEPEDTGNLNKNKYDLPMRDPGDTGDLDPNTLPDWLRTGERGDGDEREDDQETTLPSLGELSPLQATEDELPDWLVEDEDASANVFAPPQEITTDHYLELLNEAEEEEDLTGDTSDLLAGAEEGADIPDWLAEAADETGAEEAGTDTDAVGEAQAAEDWLAELGPAQTTDLSDYDSPEETDSPDQPPDVTANLPELPDWLTELGPAQTTSLDAISSEEETEEAADFFADVDMEEAGTAFGDDRDEDDLDDWLADLEPAYTGELDKATDTADFDEFGDVDEFTLTTEEAEADEDDMPGWLAELGPDQTTQLRPTEAEADTTGVDQAKKKQAPAGHGADSGDEEPWPTWLEEDEEELGSDWLTQEQEEEEVDTFSAEVEDADADAEETDAVEALPDWLSDLGGTQTLELTSEPEVDADSADLLESDEALGDLMAVDEAEESLPAWLTEEQADPAAADARETEADTESDATAAGEAEELFAEPDDTEWEEAEAVDKPLIEGEPDWLSELAASEPETPLEDEETSEAAAPPEAAGVAAGEEERSEAKTQEPEITADGDFDDLDDFGDYVEADAIFAEEVDERDIPDWMTQLGPPVGSQPPDDSVTTDTDDELIHNADLPDWITNMMPTTDRESGGLASLQAGADDFDELDDLPEELAGADLPDWLQDVTPVSETTPADRTGETAESPDWLQGEPGAGANGDTSPLGEPAPSLSSDWGDLLNDLPPPRDPAQDLARADIPEWIQELKPRQLTDEEASAEPEVDKPSPASGPLRGLQGVLEIEPVIVTPRIASIPHYEFTITPEHEKQALLLRQLAEAGPAPQPRVAVSLPPTVSAWTRLLLGLLLLAAILLGLLGPTWPQAEASAAPALADAHAAIEAAAGEPVIVAFDYSPAMAGELTPQARVLLAQLAANDSPAITLSQFTTGERIATTTTAESSDGDVIHLGFLPAESIGLRQLANCLSAATPCTTLLGRPLDTATAQALQNAQLIILLTGERDNVVNWIEQVGASANVPLVLGITRSLTPLSAPYTDSMQVVGVIAGAGDTAVYRQTLRRETLSASQHRQQNAQNMAQLSVALLLLVGLIWYGLPALLSRSKRR